MNKYRKCLIYVIVIFSFISVCLFLWGLINYCDFIIATKISFPFIFILSIVIFCLVMDIHISKYPLKESYCVVDNLFWRYIHKRYLSMATFKMPNGLLLTFPIPEEIYAKLTIGQRGKLSYRQKNAKKYYFVFFTTID